MAGQSLAAIGKAEGRSAVVEWIYAELLAANTVTGNGLTPIAVSQCAELVMDRFKFRTPNALRLALRDGLNSGKMFGKLTYPIIAEWLIAHEEAVENAHYQQHQATK